MESLTDQLARAAWEEVQAVEASGGIIAAFGSGRIVDAIGEVSALRRQALAKRKTPIVGVSEFPNLGERPVEREPVSDEEVKRALRAGLEQLDVGANRDVLLGLAQKVNDASREPGSLPSSRRGTRR